MRTKTFEIRDRATFIPVLATKLEPGCERDRYLIARAGFGREASYQARFVLLTKLSDCSTHYDIYEWNTRTMAYAQKYINENFDILETGAVVDVEFILGETKAPKLSEQETEA